MPVCSDVTKTTRSVMVQSPCSPGRRKRNGNWVSKLNRSNFWKPGHLKAAASHEDIPRASPQLLRRLHTLNLITVLLVQHFHTIKIYTFCSRFLPFIALTELCLLLLCVKIHRRRMIVLSLLHQGHIHRNCSSTIQ